MQCLFWGAYWRDPQPKHRQELHPKGQVVGIFDLRQLRFLYVALIEANWYSKIGQGGFNFWNSLPDHQTGIALGKKSGCFYVFLSIPVKFSPVRHPHIFSIEVVAVGEVQEGEHHWCLSQQPMGNLLEISGYGSVKPLESKID